MSAARDRLRWLVPLALVGTWLVAGAVTGPYAGRLAEVATNDPAAFLPRSAESTKVAELQATMAEQQGLPVIVVWQASSGKITPGQLTAAGRALDGVRDVPGVTGNPSPVLPSRDGEALQGVVTVRADLGDATGEVVGEIRAAAAGVPGTTVQIAGPAATQADLIDAFAGIDSILLAVALTVVLLILLLVYRSAVLPFLVILTAVLALGLASAVVYLLAERDVIRVDGQVQGILFILVIGAATDYALLLAARFREELATRHSRLLAIRRALRSSTGAIVASAATVALGLLALLLSDLRNTRALGPAGAIGIGCAMLAVLTFLPAALVLLGRTAYWPARPKPAGSDGAAAGGGHRLWRRVARAVDRSPRRIWAGTLLGLAVAAGFLPTLTTGAVPLSELFVDKTPSVTAQQVLIEHFPAGQGNPAVIVANADTATRVIATARDTPGVTDVRPISTAAGMVRLNATLTDPADSLAAQETVVRLREAVHDVPDADALVGGYTAEQYDTLVTTVRDRNRIVPVVLTVILLILIGLLRALVAPVLLVATVALNYLATLGVAGLVFRYLFDFTAVNPAVTLYGFVFLVALGVDYNIFLMTRVREETLRAGTRQGMLAGLTATGGVITSAGVVLAATFAALAVIPLSFLWQIALLVGFGVLLDTLVVRSLLVPALVREIGPAVWWPSRLAREPR
ncbi:MAG TPA: MMPL family transporter [Micromonosporaceae bacterium]